LVTSAVFGVRAEGSGVRLAPQGAPRFRAAQVMIVEFISPPERHTYTRTPHRHPAPAGQRPA